MIAALLFILVSQTETATPAITATAIETEDAGSQVAPAPAPKKAADAGIVDASLPAPNDDAGDLSLIGPLTMPRALSDLDAGTLEEDHPASILETSSRILSDRREHRTLGRLVPLAFLFWFSLWIARQLRRWRLRMLPQGLFPRTAAAVQTVLRVLAALMALELVAMLLPANFAPALPWLVVAAAAAMGWSMRDVLPDVIAGVVLSLERRVRIGDWIEAPEVCGQVRAFGLRAAQLVDARGREINVPNRQLLRSAVASDACPWPRVEVRVVLTPETGRRDAERWIREVVLAMPHLAPDAPSVLRLDEEGCYLIRARVLEGRFADLFAAALRARLRVP